MNGEQHEVLAQAGMGLGRGFQLLGWLVQGPWEQGKAAGVRCPPRGGQAMGAGGYHALRDGTLSLGPHVSVSPLCLLHLAQPGGLPTLSRLRGGKWAPRQVTALETLLLFCGRCEPHSQHPYPPSQSHPLNYREKITLDPLLPFSSGAMSTVRGGYGLRGPLGPLNSVLGLSWASHSASPCL